MLKDYISEQVSKELASVVRDRDILETESAIRVFERAWGWAKILGAALGVVFGTILAIAGWVGWKEFDLSKTAQNAKSSVESTAAQTRDEIKKTSAESVDGIQKASREAIEANRNSAANAAQLSTDMKRASSRTRAELRDEAESVRVEVVKSQTELEAAKKIQPEFDSMRV